MAANSPEELRVDLPAFRIGSGELTTLWTGICERMEGGYLESELSIQLGNDEWEFDIHDDLSQCDALPDTISNFRLMVALSDRSLEITTQGDFFSKGWVFAVARGSDERWRINLIDYVRAFVERRKTAANQIDRASFYMSFFIPVILPFSGMFENEDRIDVAMASIFAIPALRQLSEYARESLWKTAVILVRKRETFFSRHKDVVPYIAMAIAAAAFLLK